MLVRIIGPLAVLLLVMVSCAEREVNVFVDADEAVGRQVDVSGRVLEVLSDNAFRIGPADEEATGAVLVVHADEDVIHVGQVVRVEGVVRRLQVLDVEQELGVDLDDEVLVDVEGQPGIVATQVQILQDVERDVDVVATETATERATETATEQTTVTATETAIATETVTASPSPTS